MHIMLSAKVAGLDFSVLQVCPSSGVKWRHMSRIPAFLQWLLIAILALNGVGTAFASVSMQMAGATTATPTGMTTPEHGGDHGDCPMAVAAPAYGSDQASCGGTGYCDFACAQILALAPPSQHAPMSHRTDIRIDLSTGAHDSPLLAGVTRPPIA